MTQKQLFRLVQAAGKRQGVLDCTNVSISTPTLFISTSHFLPPHLTPDNLESTIGPSMTALEMYADQLAEKPAQWKACPMTLKKFAGVPQYTSILASRDPYYVGREDLSINTEHSVLVEHLGGISKLAMAEDMLAMAGRLAPDLIISPADRFPLPITTKRAKKALVRTASYYNILKNTNIPVFATIPGVTEESFLKSIASADGYAITGLVAYEAVLRESYVKAESIAKIIAVLPRDKPIYYRGLCAIGDVSQLYALGVDIFDSLYPQLLTELGYALNITNGGGELLHMWDAKFAGDNEPFSMNCHCVACSQPYMRAYVHHLLLTKEMLGPLLLMSHNLAQYARHIHGLIQ